MNYVWWCGLDSFSAAQDAVVDSCEHGNEFRVLGQVNDSQLLKQGLTLIVEFIFVKLTIG